MLGRVHIFIGIIFGLILDDLIGIERYNVGSKGKLIFKIKLLIPIGEQCSVSQSQPIVSNLNEASDVRGSDKPGPKGSLFHLCQIKFQEFVFFGWIQDWIHSLLSYRTSIH